MLDPRESYVMTLLHDYYPAFVLIDAVEETLATRRAVLDDDAVDQLTSRAAGLLTTASITYPLIEHGIRLNGGRTEHLWDRVERAREVFAPGGAAERLTAHVASRDPDWVPPEPINPDEVLPFPDLPCEPALPFGLQLVWAPNGLHLRLYVTNLGPEPLTDLQVEGTDAVGRLQFVPAADADPHRVPPGAHVGFGVQVAHGGQGELPLRITLTTDGSEIESVLHWPMG